MGLSLWYLQRLEDGSFSALPRKTWHAFLRNGEPLPDVRSEFVHLVEIVVELEKRRPTQICRMVFTKMRVHSDGRLDREHQFEATRAVLESIAFPISDAPDGVVNASHRFARRQHEHMSEWKPTAAEVRGLAAAVNQRAGCRLL